MISDGAPYRSSTPVRSSPPLQRLSGSTNTSSSASPLPPTFTVTSSITTATASKPRPLNPDAKAFELPATSALDLPHTLHPGASLFAMPERAHHHQHGLTGATAFCGGSGAPGMVTDFTPTWGTSLSSAAAAATAGKRSPLPSHRAASSPPRAPDDAATQQQLLEHIRSAYTELCTARHQHMVAVLNLEPSTTKADLAKMFFPTGASEAVIVDTNEFQRSQPGVGGAAPRRRVGVVFFDRKDFAMVGIEKRDNFVPNGQHQPLVVRYCGPDAELTTLSVASENNAVGGEKPQVVPKLPWAPAAGSEEGEQVNATMRAALAAKLPDSGVPVVVHGVDPATMLTTLPHLAAVTEAREVTKWPQPDPLRSTAWRYRSVSALLWYPTQEHAEAALRVLAIGFVERGAHSALLFPALKPSQPTFFTHPFAQQPQPASVLAAGLQWGVPTINVGVGAVGGAQRDHGTAAESEAMFKEIDQHFLRTYPDPAMHLVGVHNLSEGTDDTKLIKIFYPNGAHDAKVFAAPVAVAGKTRRSGVALFDSQGMAEAAAAKMHEFVPHGQTRPLIARYLPRPQTVAADLKDGQMAALSSGRQERASTPLLDDASTPDELLHVIEALLRASPVGKNLSAAMTQLATHEEASKFHAEQLAELIAQALVRANQHATALATPLSGALLELHEQLCVAPLGAEPLSASGPERVWVVMQIARRMMVLLTDQKAPGEARKVAAVLCAYAFQFPYLLDTGTPCGFAVACLRRFEKEVQAAKRFLSLKGGEPIPREEEERNRPWATLVEALRRMVQMWRDSPASRACVDKESREYEERIRDFYSVTPVRNRSKCVSPTPGDASAGALSTTPGISGGTRRSAMLTPSSRPTPRGVTTRFSPGSGCHKLAAPTAGGRGAEGAGDSRSAPPPQVALTPGSDQTQGVSADVSLENTPNVIAALRKSGFPISIQRTPARTPSTTTGHHSHTAMAPQLPALCVQRERGDSIERTVYITKLPAHLTAGQVRRLLLYFGEFNKVRLYRDGKESVPPLPSGPAGSPQMSGKHCFGFVEFAGCASAKSMIEYFRNSAHVANSFEFMCEMGSSLPAVWGASCASSLGEADIVLLRSTRASQARNPIQDQQALDAVQEHDGPGLGHDTMTTNRSCQFGLANALLRIDDQGITDAVVGEQKCSNPFATSLSFPTSADNTSRLDPIAPAFSSLAQRSVWHTDPRAGLRCGVIEKVMSAPSTQHANVAASAPAASQYESADVSADVLRDLLRIQASSDEELDDEGGDSDLESQKHLLYVFGRRDNGPPIVENESDAEDDAGRLHGK